MLAIYTVVILAVAGKLVQVQVVRAEEYAERGVAQRARSIELPARRGRLYDREGQVLATSVDAATVYADPRAFRPGETPDGLPVPPAADPRAVAQALAPLLGRDVADIEPLLTRDAHFVYLARQLDRSVGAQVNELGLPGIGVLTEPRRVYPAGQLAGQVVGFTDIDGVGLHGLEFQHDGVLRGRPGQLVLERAPGGLDIASGVRELAPPLAGADLVLTIDREIQHVAERAALEAVERFSAVGASVVVMDAATGDVLAMASAPGFDPGDRGEVDPANLRNRAVTDVFEPGSVQKAITAAAALEEGVVTPDTVMTVADSIRVGNKTFTDSHRHPTVEMTFTEVMEESSNVGTIMVAQQLGEERLADYLARFGYGQRLGVGFPGESPGLIMPVDQWWSTSLPTIAIGQGVATTLLQTASFYATLANDGIATQPRILRGTVGEDGRLTPAEPGATRRVVSETTARQVREMLATVVVGESGTGKRAAVPGYTVAGKTGTARKPLVDGRGYSGQYIASFVGMAPAEDPQLVVAVMVDEPFPIYGGVVAAPVFSEVMQFSLLQRRVQPTHPGATLEASLRDAAAARAAAEAAARAAEREGPATAPDTPTSPVVGAPAGGDGRSVTDPGPARTTDAGTPVGADPGATDGSAPAG
jgi:cell division protein FtsI (penicillin-binding protein 3)